MIGDSWERDIRGALQVGIAPVWVSGGRPAPEADPRVTVLLSVDALAGTLDSLDEAATRD